MATKPPHKSLRDIPPNPLGRKGWHVQVQSSLQGHWKVVGASEGVRAFAYGYMQAYHSAHPYEELRLCNPAGVCYEVMGWVTPDTFEFFTPRERAILQETVTTLYLYGHNDKHNRMALRYTLRKLMGHDVDAESHTQMRDLYHKLVPDDVT